MYVHPGFRALEAERKRQGYTAGELARACGYDRSYVTQYERGHRAVSLRFKSAASRVLGVAVEELFPGEGSGEHRATRA